MRKSLVFVSQHLISLFLVSLLFGCGEGSESPSISPPEPSPVDNIQVVDGYSVASPDKATIIDISPFVRGQGAALMDMYSKQPECVVASLSGLTAEVEVQGARLCDYTFTVHSVASSVPTESANLHVMASNAVEPILPPLSETTELGSDTTFDVQQLLGGDWPAGYELDSSSVVVQGGVEQGSVVVNGNKIIYTPPTKPDWNRIVFMLQDPQSLGDERLGTLYVTISDGSNHPPVINKPKYDYAESGQSVRTFEKKTIDLENLTGLSIVDPDQHSWQLIDVQSYSASVISSDPNSVTNTRFEFTAGTVGEHIVNYVVGDHFGGFQAGLIKFTVTPDERTKDWKDIQIGDLRFFATPLYSEVAGKSIVAEAIWDQQVNGGAGNTIAAVDSVAARAYCSGTHLASLTELQTLFSDNNVAVERQKYPHDRTYIASDNGGFITFDLNNGAIDQYVPGQTQNQYVICASSAQVNYIPATKSLVSDGAWHVLGTLVSEEDRIGSVQYISGMDLGVDPIDSRNFRLSPAGCKHLCSLEAKGDMNHVGTADIIIADRIDSANDIAVSAITFIQNAKVSKLSISRDKTLGDGSHYNIIKVGVVGEDGKPAPAGMKVKFNFSGTSSDKVHWYPYQLGWRNGNISEDLAWSTVDSQGEAEQRVAYIAVKGESLPIKLSEYVENGLPLASPQSFNASIGYQKVGVLNGAIYPNSTPPIHERYIQPWTNYWSGGLDSEGQAILRLCPDLSGEKGAYLPRGTWALPNIDKLNAFYSRYPSSGVTRFNFLVDKWTPSSWYDRNEFMVKDFKTGWQGWTNTAGNRSVEFNIDCVMKYVPEIKNHDVFLYTVGTFTPHKGSVVSYNDAESICRGRGMILPTKDELVGLAKSGQMTGDFGWDSSNRYKTSDSSISVDITTGTTHPSSPGQSEYVSCLKRESFQ